MALLFNTQKAGAGFPPSRSQSGNVRLAVQVGLRARQVVEGLVLREIQLSGRVQADAGAHALQGGNAPFDGPLFRPGLFGVQATRLAAASAAAAFPAAVPLTGCFLRQFLRFFLQLTT